MGKQKQAAAPAPKKQAKTNKPKRELIKLSKRLKILASMSAIVGFRSRKAFIKMMTEPTGIYRDVSDDAANTATPATA